MTVIVVLLILCFFVAALLFVVADLDKLWNLDDHHRDEVGVGRDSSGARQGHAADTDTRRTA